MNENSSPRMKEAMRLLILLFVAAALALATALLSGLASLNFLQHMASITPASKGLLTVSLLVSTAVLLLLGAWARNKRAQSAAQHVQTSA
ncbi:hypothetical protein F1735_32975 [Massilia sp. CCM 8694]|uniref:DUF1049 domain-containing protein n=1 Tax=Massilia genomosp. 1 TaxID=2609280 RepID=A0ABX0N6A5_9BURK|nr:hypothetical protein [Massilia genomosp. 1]